LETQRFDIFLSYARHDGTPLASRLAKSLRETGMRVFWDQDSIPPGINWEDAIDVALNEAAHILVILTPFSVKSEEVTAEWRPMLSKGKNILPLLYLPCETPRRLSMRQYIDFQDERNYLIAFSALVQALNDFVGSNEVFLDLTGDDLLKRGESYFGSGQIEQASNDYLLALRATDKTIRKKAAILVGKAQVVKHLPLILEILQNEVDSEVRAELLDSIRKFVQTSNWPTTVSNLLEEIQPYVQDESAEVRNQALRALAYSNLPEVVPILVRALFTDPVEKVRYQMALSLGRFKIDEATTALINALTDTGSEVRRAAARALGVHGNAEALPMLKRVAQSDKNREVRTTASEAIENIQRGS
jgi:hypothetical protein